MKQAIDVGNHIHSECRVLFNGAAPSTVALGQAIQPAQIEDRWKQSIIPCASLYPHSHFIPILCLTAFIFLSLLLELSCRPKVSRLIKPDMASCASTFTQQSCSWLMNNDENILVSSGKK